DEVIRARGGERIVLSEYPDGHVEEVNARLNAIAFEQDRATRFVVPVPWRWALLLVVLVVVVVSAIIAGGGDSVADPVVDPVVSPSPALSFEPIEPRPAPSFPPLREDYKR